METNLNCYRNLMLKGVVSFAMKINSHNAGPTSWIGCTEQLRADKDPCFSMSDVNKDLWEVLR